MQARCGRRGDQMEGGRGAAPREKGPCCVPAFRRDQHPGPCPVGQLRRHLGSAAVTLAPAADAEDIPLTTVRRLTAQRLAVSFREAPHFYLTVMAAADQLLAFRVRANQRHGADVKITATDLLTRACGS